MDPTTKTKKKRRKRRKRSNASEGVPASTHQHKQPSAVPKDAAPLPASHSDEKQKISHSEKKNTSSIDEKANQGRRKRPRRDDRSARQEQSSTSAKTTSYLQHPFEVDATDHCETPLEAYRDVAALLDQVAKSLGKTRRNLSIYDPYFCDGGVKVKLTSLGFGNVRNENEDFYKAIQNRTVPEFDVLLTNPPYSGMHVEKLLSFVGKSNKPFLLLLPHYVYTKDYYQRALGSQVKPFFLVPKSRYSYLPPSWVQNGSTALTKGKVTTSPFPSFWYCHGNNVSAQWLTQTNGSSGVYRHDRKIQYANCTAHIPREMKGEFDASKKRRPNARSRRRAAAKKRAAMAGIK